MNELNEDLTKKVRGVEMRIHNEIANIFNQCQSVSYEWMTDKSIALTVRRNSNIYEIRLKDYPFKIPTNVRYNGIDYKQSLMTSSDKIKNIMKTMYRVDCLCCSTILCAEWTPVNNIAQILNEMDKMSRIKKEIRIRLNCDYVRDRYKCYFAEFEKYLF